MHACTIWTPPARGFVIEHRHLRVLSWIVTDEIARRQLYGHPIPPALRDVHAALQRELSAAGQPDTPVLSRLKTTEQLAAEWGCSARTVRRRAAATGARKLPSGHWVFEEGQT
jgi:hypothetical protein